MSAAVNQPHEFVQPQTGEKFTLIVNGDEFGASFRTPEGYTVRFNTSINAWVYCDRATNGRLILTTHPAHLEPPENILRGLVDETNATMESRNERIQNSYFGQSRLFGTGNAFFIFGSQNGLLPGRTLWGDVTGLVVIVEFKDVKAFPNAVDLVEQLYNGPEPLGVNSTTVRDYFQTISNNKFNLTNHVYPIIVQLPRNKEYYSRHSIVPIVLRQIKDNVNFADFDSRGEGIVDCLTFLYAGNTLYGDPDAGTAELWPHNSFYNLTKIEDGRTYQTHFYMLTSLGVNENEMTIGTSCHELAHMTLRYPDLYDYGSRDHRGMSLGLGNSDGIGPYCLMGHGNHIGNGTSPVPVCAYLRKLSGFIDNEVILNNVNKRHEIRADDYSTIFRYVISPNESFIVENYSAVGLRTGMTNYRRRTVSGVEIYNISGLAIMHCDTEGSNEWQQNDRNYHYQTYLLQADGQQHLERNFGADAADLYSNIEGIAASFNTFPSTRRWDGADSGLVIRDISEPGEVMTFVSGSEPIDAE